MIIGSVVNLEGLENLVVAAVDKAPAATPAASAAVANTTGETKGADPSPVRLVLTDGWYTIGGEVDAGLTRLVKRGRIAVGTKLRVWGAEMGGMSSGGGGGGLRQAQLYRAHEQVSLRLASNSTRPAAWDAVLGAQPTLFFPVNVRGLCSEGGAVPSIEVMIQRRYHPMVRLYDDSGGGGGRGRGRAIYRNLAVHQEKQREAEAKFRKERERAQVEVEAEVWHEMEATGHGVLVRRINGGPKELYLRMVRASDPDGFLRSLDPSMRERLMEFRERVKIARREEVGELPLLW